MQVFIDSNFWIALCSPNDTLHKKSRAIARRLKHERADLVTSSDVIAETVTVLSMRAGRKIAIAAGELLVANPMLEIVHIEEELYLRAWDIFRATSKKDVGFVDCSILAVLQTMMIPTLVTFDCDLAHFAVKQHVE